MKDQSEILENKRLKVAEVGIDGGVGWVYLNGLNAKPIVVVWSFGGGWEHVSASYSNRCPTWDEMCKLKDMFFEPEEVVVQYHPKQSQYVNIHPYCLHLWRKCGEDFETPPTLYV